MNHQADARPSYLEFLLLGLSFLILFLFGLRTISGSDIWLHLAAGRHALQHGPATVDPFSFGLPAGTPWMQTTWLYDIMVFHVWRMGGATLAILAHVAAIMGAFLLLLPACRTFSRPIHQAAALLLCAWILAPVFTLRPFLFSLLFLGLFMHLLSRPKPTPAAFILLTLAQVLWTNMHASFFWGPALAAIRAVEAFRETKKFPAAHVILLAVLSATTLLNPFGAGLWREVAGALMHPERSVMLEWISPFQASFLPLKLTWFTTAALVLIAAVFIFRRERLPLLLTAGAVAGAISMIQSNHHLDRSALLIFPFLAMSLATLSGLVLPRLPAALGSILPRAGWAGLAAAVAFSAFWIITNRYYIQTGSASSFGLRVNTDVLPVAAVDILGREAALPDHLLNLAQDGGYLLWQRPGHRVFADPRGGWYGGLFFNRVGRQLAGQDNAIERSEPLPDADGLLLNATWSGSMAAMMNYLRQDQWAIGYFDGTSLLFLRKTSGNAGALDSAVLQQRGLDLIKEDFRRYQEGLKRRFVKPPNPARLMGAASIYHAMGRFRESLAILALINEGSPRMVSAWVNRGIAEVKLKKPAQAIASLEHAVKLVPASALTWLWLGEAYRMAGKETEASGAWAKARELDPMLADRFNEESTAFPVRADFKVPPYYQKPR